MSDRDVILMDRENDRRADEEDARGLAADIERDNTWRELKTRPEIFTIGWSAFNPIEIAEEPLANLLRAVACARDNDELRAWHMTQIANIVIAAVTKAVDDAAFAGALEQTA